MAFRIPGFETVATTGPRFFGSRLPQSRGSGSTPKLLGCVVSFTRRRVDGWMDMLYDYTRRGRIPKCVRCKLTRCSTTFDDAEEGGCSVKRKELSIGS
jgi:hypothetical protein